jgi:hypothetical protein
MRKKPIPDPGSRVKNAQDPGSGSATLIICYVLTTGVQKNTGLHEQLNLKVKPTYVIVFPILSVQALDEFHSL